jgi:uncharacterized protein YndB with AHSA1/START domain
VTPLHDTLSFRRHLPAPPDQVFAAFESVEARKDWGRPAPSVTLAYDATDFRAGGTDIQRCLVDGREVMRVEATYHRIDAGRTITWFEKLFRPQAKVADAIALCTVALAGEAATDLSLTIQLTSFGASQAGDYRQGNEKALDNLVRRFA